MLFNNKNTGELQDFNDSYEPEFLINTFIIGAQKSGTTTIANMLNSNKDVCMSGPKEPRFFEYEYPLGIKYYNEKYFPHYNGEKIICEARTTHMFIPFVSDRIEQTNHNAKIIAILRNPIERAFSAWHHFQRMRPGREILSVHDALFESMDYYNPNLFRNEQEYVQSLDPMGGSYNNAYVEAGCYYDLLTKNWIGKFNDLKILFMQDLVEDPSKLYLDMCDFLDIEPMDYDSTPKNMYSDYSIKEIKTNYPYLYSKLSSFFRNDVAMLSQFLNRDLLIEWDIER